MHEIIAGIIADSAAMERESGIAELRSGNAGNTNVNSHGLHVKAVHCYMMTMGVQVRVGPGRAVSADDVDFAIGQAERGQEVVEEIEHPRIIGMHITGAAVAQVVVQPGKSGCIVCSIVTVDDVETLPGVEIEEVKGVGIVEKCLSVWLGRHRSQNHEGRDERQNRPTAKFLTCEQQLLRLQIA